MGLETNVTDVAQNFAQYLIDNNAFDHNADGRSPWERLEDNPSIGACSDFLNVAENHWGYYNQWFVHSVTDRESRFILGCMWMLPAPGDIGTPFYGIHITITAARWGRKVFLGLEEQAVLSAVGTLQK